MDEAQNNNIPNAGVYENELEEFDEEYHSFMRSYFKSKKSSTLKSCGCADNYYQGRYCECNFIKEDLKTLLAVGDSIDNLIANMHKALRIPSDEAPYYDLVDMICQVKVKSLLCPCESEADHCILKKGESSSKKSVLHACSCSALPKRRYILKIIRNDVYNKIKCVQKLHFELMERNKQNRNNVERNLENLPQTQRIKLDKSFYELLHRCLAIEDSEFESLPSICSIDKKKMDKYSVEGRILPKQYEGLHKVEEVIKALLENKNQYKADNVCRTVIKKRKVKCRCHETKKKIEVLIDFQNLIAKLHPVITGRKEESFGLCVDYVPGRRTIQQLAEYMKDTCFFSEEFLEKHEKFISNLMKKEGLFQEEQMIKELLKILCSCLIIINMRLKPDEEKLVDELIKNPNMIEITQKCASADAYHSELKKQKEVVENLISSLQNYLRRLKEKLTPAEEKYWLIHLNDALTEFLQKQQHHFKKMEELVPDFLQYVLDEVQNQNEIVEKICKDDFSESDYLFRARTEDLKDPQRERLKELLTALTKPYCNNMGFPSSKTNMKGENQESENKIVFKEQEEKRDGKSIAEEVSNELPAQFKNADHWGNINKEITFVLGLRRNEDDIYHDKEGMYPYSLVDKENPESSLSTSLHQKNIIDEAYLEGWKILSEPDPRMVIHENLFTRKRLLHELNLGKETEISKNILRNREELAQKLRELYVTKNIKKCKCLKNLRKLKKLRKSLEDFILNPEKYNIEFVGPMTAVEFMARVYAKKFTAPKKHVTKEHKPKRKPIPKVTKTNIIPTYGENRFDIVWNEGGLDGMFAINLDAQMMENEKIVIRPQFEKRVKVMSGGRMGLEPLYGEYVCNGMLDAAVLGTNIDDPLIYTIFQTILELDSGQGVVVIILNEPENRLNTMLAIERASEMGVEARLVLARDDISVEQPDLERNGLRGHSGIILQFKVASGMAMKGHNLDEISRVTQNMQVATLGCMFGNYGTYIGSGIREGQGDLMPALQADDVLYEMMDYLLEPTGFHSIAPEHGTDMVLLINRFMLPTDEVYSIVSAISHQLLERGANISRVYHSGFSSFQAQGFSITLAKNWNNQLIPFLDLPTTCLHWPPHLSGVNNNSVPKTIIHRDQPFGGKTSPLSIPVIYDIMDRVLKDARNSVKKLSLFDTVLSRGMLQVVLNLRPNLDLNQLNLDRPYLLFKYVGKLLRNNLRWHGKLFRLFFLAASQEFLKDPECVINWQNWCLALKKGTQAVAGYTKFKVGQGTIIDFLVPVADSLCRTKKGWSPLTFLYGGLEKVKTAIEDKKCDPGILILDFVFKNIYEGLLEHMGHYRGEEWWKVIPFPKILLVNPLNKDRVCYDVIPEELKEKIKKKEAESQFFSPQSTNGSAVFKDPCVSETSIETLEEIERDDISIVSPGYSYGHLEQEEEEEFLLEPQELPIEL